MKIDISAALSPVPVRVAPEGPRYMPANRPFQGIPGIERCGDGVMYATWYTGGEWEGPENYAVLVRSADGGATWTDPFAVVDPPGKVRAYDPGLWMDPRGRLWWFWSQSYGFFDGRAGVWVSVNDDPVKRPEAWSAPRRIADGVMMNKPTVLSTGAWAFPAAVWRLTPWHGDPRKIEDDVPHPLLPETAAVRGANLAVTRDGGESFELLRGPDMPERSFDEHMAVERTDGGLMLFVRTHYGIGMNLSTDAGRNWTAPDDRSFYRAGPSTRFFIRRLASGALLLVYHESVRVRCNLTAYLSRDDGRTWSGGLLLDERPGVSYPDGVQANDGTITVVYDRDRTGAREILFAEFTEEDVAARRIVNPGSRLCRIISRPPVASGGV